MNITKRLGPGGLVLMMSILFASVTTLSAQTNKPGPLQRFFQSLRGGFHEPQRKSTTHHSSRKQSSATADSSSAGAQATASPDTSGGASIGSPPNEKNTRSTSKATTKKGDDMPYGTPVAGKQGFVTSPFSPNSGYIDVRGFAPGTPVKDPYTGKVFLTP